MRGVVTVGMNLQSAAVSLIFLERIEGGACLFHALVLGDNKTRLPEFFSECSRTRVGDTRRTRG